MAGAGSPSLAAQMLCGRSAAHWLAPGKDLFSLMKSMQKVPLLPTL